MITVTRNHRLLLLTAALIAVMGTGLTAEKQPVTKPELSKAQECAGRASTAELAARFIEASDLYLQAAVASAEAGATADRKKDRPGSDALWAEAEFLMEKAAALAEATSGRRRLLSGLKRLLKLARSRPVVQARATWRLAQALRAANEDKAAAKELSRLDFVTDWQIIGPFDNERGQGFAKTYPPEKSIDLKARYPGKKREVSWRRNPAKPADGLVDLAGMLRPNREAVAYLATFLEVDARTDIPAAIRLGSGDGVRVWLNGKQVFDHDAHREAGFDQDAFGIILRPGWNALLVKVAQSQGTWGLRLRLTDPTGAPLSRVRSRADQLRRRAAPAKKEPPAPGRGAIDHFAKRVKTNAKDADALMRLGFLTARLGAYDREGGARPDYDLLKRAANARPADARLWYELSFVSAVSGRMSAETNENPRREALEESTKLSPSAAAELELARYYLRRYGNFKKTVRHLTRARRRNSDSLEIKLLDVDVAAERGDTSAALAAAARLVRFKPEEARAWVARARLFLQADNPVHAAESFAAAIKLDASGSVLVSAREAFEESGQAYRSLELLEQLLRRRPYDIELRRERARLLAGRRDFGAAIEECRKALRIAPEDHRLLAAIAEYLDWLGKKKEARRLRTRALKFMPNFVELERQVEYLEGRPGYDRRYRENTAGLLPDGARIQGTPGDPGSYLLYKVIDRVYPDGTGSRTVHLLVKILSEHGAKRFAVQRVLYYAGEQRAVIRSARVYRAGGGSENAKVFPERTYTRAERELGVRLAQFPSPGVGDIVEFEYRIDDLEQGFFGKYFGSTFHFRREMPVTLAKYVLIAPRDLKLHINPVRSAIKPTVEQDERAGTTVYTWTARDQKKIVREPMMPAIREASPAVQVSTFEDWKTFGKWYWGLIRKQHHAGPLVKRKARELGAGARTELDKIKAVYNHVVTDVRYVAWEFGVHGFKPYRAEQVLARRFGDCKDKSTLICSMLAEHKIKAYPVLIRSQLLREKQDLRLPLISHFNHCIVYVPAGKNRPEMWLDGTAANTSSDALPDANRNAEVAVITPEGARVLRIPASGPKLNTTSDSFVLSLARDGSGSGEVRATAGGGRSVVFRRVFGNPLHRARILDRLHGRRNPGVRTGSAGSSDLRDLNVPVSYRYSLTLPKLARERDGLMELQLPDNPLRGVLGYGGKDELFPKRLAAYCPGAARTHDLVLPAAWQHSAHYEIALPPGWKPAELPADAKLETDFGRLTITRKFEAGRLIIDKSLGLSVTRVPAAKYAAFRKFCLALDRLEARRVYLVKGMPPVKTAPRKKNGGHGK